MASDDTLQSVLTGLGRHGDHPAVITVRDGSCQTLSYVALEDRALRLAGGLTARGLEPGQPVALFAGNSAEWIAVRLALIAIGALAVPIDPSTDAATLRGMLDDTACRLIFTDRERLPALRAASGRRRQDVVLLDAPADEAGAAALPSLSGQRLRRLPEIAPSSIAALFFTSGTTGAPKGVPLSHANIIANLDALRELAVSGPDDRVLLPLPLHHAYPFVVGMLTPLLSGSAIVLPESVAGPAIVEALRAARVTGILGVPRLYEAMRDGIEARIADRGRTAARLYRALLGASMFARERLGLGSWERLFRGIRHAVGPELRFLVSGGARLEPDLERTLRGLGWQVLNGWGLVETASVATFNPPGAERPGTTGRPGPGVRLRIDAPDAVGIGEVLLRGPNLFAGYYRNPAADDAAFTRDGWFRTGDLGRFDAHGYLVVAGRAKEIIVLSGGKNVAPEAVEKVYGRSPYVREVAILERGGALVGLVVPELAAARAAATMRIDQLLRISLAELSQSLPPHERLTGYAVTRTPLPRTRLGKFRRHLLPALYDRARRGEAAGPPVLSQRDEALLASPRTRDIWHWLMARFPDTALSPDTSPQLDLGIDSLGWIELVTDLERRFGVRLAEEALARVVTLRDLLREAAAATTTTAKADRTAAALPSDAERWLAPTGPVRSALGFVVYGIAWLFCRLYFRLRTEGTEKLPQSGAFVLATNHCSDLDPVVLAASLPWRLARRTYWSADAARLFKTGFRRWFARTTHIFPVDDRVPEAGLAYGLEVLRRDGVLIWFPEAWRSPDGALQDFLPGIGVVIGQSGAASVPVHIAGSFDAMPRTATFPRPAPIRVRFGAPVSAETLARRTRKSDAPRRIAQRLRDRVAELTSG